MTDAHTTMLRLAARRVSQLRFDHAFGLEFHEDGNGFSLRIGVPFTMTIGDASFSYDPERCVECGPLLALLHTRVVSATAGSTGRLDIVLTDDRSLHVEPHPRFEAWELVGGDGTRVISVPGGGLATWNAHRSKDDDAALS